ncbi:MAG: S-layer homology domain-containing protein [Actinobacteria bacterium]|nr:S-layer homology domain-containing protein [Actinomycetota bacterium]
MNVKKLVMSKKLLVLLIATVCLLLLGTTAYAASTFTDTVGHWAQPLIEKVAALGIMEGHNPTTFGPDENVTRAQLAATEARAYDKQAADTTKLVNDKLSTVDRTLALWNIQPGLGTVMIEYGNRMARLWFAGNAGNWDMAQYQLDEMVEIQEVGETTRPARKAMLKAFEDSFLTPLGTTIAAQDKPAFTTAFNNMIAGCNGCHAASASADWNSYQFVKIQKPTNDPADYIQWNTPGGTGNKK